MAGNLDESIDINQKDEVGMLAQHLREMVGTLQRLIRESTQAKQQAESEAAQARQNARIADEASHDALAKQDIMLRTATELGRVVDSLSQSIRDPFGPKRAVQRRGRGPATSGQATCQAMQDLNGTTLAVVQNALRTAETTENARNNATSGATLANRVDRGVRSVAGEIHRHEAEHALWDKRPKASDRSWM